MYLLVYHQQTLFLGGEKEEGRCEDTILFYKTDSSHLPCLWQCAYIPGEVQNVFLTEQTRTERHRVPLLAPLRASSPAAAGPGQQQQRGQGAGLHCRGHCWEPRHRLCFADSVAACWQRCHRCPGRMPALKAEGEQWLAGTCASTLAQGASSPTSTGESKAWHGTMGQKRSPTTTGALQSAPVSEHLPVSHNKPEA